MRLVLPISVPTPREETRERICAKRMTKDHCACIPCRLRNSLNRCSPIGGKAMSQTTCPCESHESISDTCRGIPLTDLGCNACLQDMGKYLIRGDDNTTITYADMFVLNLQDFVQGRYASSTSSCTLSSFFQDFIRLSEASGVSLATSSLYARGKAKETKYSD